MAKFKGRMSERRLPAKGLARGKGGRRVVSPGGTLHPKEGSGNTVNVLWGVALVISDFPWQAGMMASRGGAAPCCPGHPGLPRRGGTAFPKFPAWAHGGAGEPWRAGVACSREEPPRPWAHPPPEVSPGRCPLPRSRCKGVCVLISF